MIECAQSISPEKLNRIWVHLSCRHFESSGADLVYGYGCHPQYLRTGDFIGQSAISLIRWLLFDRNQENALFRLKIMIKFYSILAEPEFEIYVTEHTQALLHWLLLLELKKHGCPKDAALSENTELPAEIVSVLTDLAVWRRKLSVLEFCYQFVVSKKLIGLPSTFLDALFRKYAAHAGYESDTLALSPMFYHFITVPITDVEDSIYPMTKADNHETVKSFVEFAGGKVEGTVLQKWFDKLDEVIRSDPRSLERLRFLEGIRQRLHELDRSGPLQNRIHQRLLDSVADSDSEAAEDLVMDRLDAEDSTDAVPYGTDSSPIVETVTNTKEKEKDSTLMLTPDSNYDRKAGAGPGRSLPTTDTTRSVEDEEAQEDTHGPGRNCY